MDISSQISFSGLATGLDSRAIIDALLGVERIPVVRLEQQKAKLGRQNDVFSRLDSRLDALLEKVRKIDTSAELSSYSATSSDESALAVSATGSAAPGSYAIEISQLARAESRTTQGFADRDTTLVASGSFTITSGGQTYTVDLGDDDATLDEIQSAIQDSGAPVTATIIDNGSGVDPFQLVVSSRQTGAAAGFEVDFSGLTNLDPERLNLDNNATVAAGGSRLQQGVDAQLTINGLAVSRGSNTISDLTPGLNLDLNSVTTGPVQVTVDVDASGIKKKIQEFVSAYNDVASTITAQNVVDSEGNSDSVLFGDSGLRSIQSRLRSLVTASSGSGGSSTSLAALGIRTDATGQLNIDEGDLDEAIASDLDGVLALFTTPETGVGNRFRNTIDEITDPVNGVIKSRQDGISKRQKLINDRIEGLEDRLGSYEKRLVQRYANLETLVSSLQAQGSSLSGIFGR